MIILSFFIGSFLGIFLMGLLSANSYDRGYKDAKKEFKGDDHDRPNR